MPKLTPKPTPATGGSPAPSKSNSPADVNLQHGNQSASPAMPHERDEGGNATGGIPSERVQQGSRDVKRGLRDTSRGEESQAAYDKLKK